MSKTLKDKVKEFIKAIDEENAKKSFRNPTDAEKETQRNRAWQKFSKAEREADWWTGFKAYLEYANVCEYFVSIVKVTVPKHLYGSIIDLYDRDGKHYAKFLDSEQNVTTLEILSAAYIHSFFDGWLYMTTVTDGKGEKHTLEFRTTDYPPHVGESYDEIMARRKAWFDRPVPTTMVVPMVKNTGDLGGSLRDIITSNPLSELAAADDTDLNESVLKMTLKEENTATIHKRDIFLEMITRLKP